MLFDFGRLAQRLNAVGAGRVTGRGWLLYGLLILILPVVMISAGWKIAAQTNQDSLGSDQGAYIGLAREQQHALYPFATDGTRNGLVSWLAGHVFDPNGEAFFEKAKRLNVVWAALGTVVLGFFFARTFPALVAWNLSALAGLGALLGIAGVFGAEVWLYLLFFAGWVVSLRLLRENSLTHYALLGVVSALASLAKPSGAPALQLFIVLTLIAWGACLIPSLRARQRFLPETWQPVWVPGGLILLLALFFLLLSPRMVDAWKKFDDPLYNMSRFTFWLDDWDSGYHHMGFFRRDRVMELDESIRPTPQSYFKRNGVSGAISRLQEGMAVRAGQLFLPEKRIRLWRETFTEEPRRVVLTHRGLYLMLAWGTAILAMGWALKTRKFPPVRRWLLPSLFVSGCLFGYWLAFGWFYPVGPGHRFPMMFYLPILWTGFLVADRLRRDIDSKWLGSILAALHLFVAALLVERLYALAITSTFGELRYTF